MNTNIYNVSKKIIVFYSVGGVAFIGNTFITYMISDYLGYPFELSIVCVFLYNISIIFRLHKKITFKKPKVTQSQYVFFVLWVIIMTALLYFGGLSFKGLYGDSYGVSSIITMIIITLINFIVQSRIVFSKKDD